MSTSNQPKLIGYPWAAYAGMPDRWDMDKVLPSHCLSFLYFQTKEAAWTYYLAIERRVELFGDRLMGGGEPEMRHELGKKEPKPTGRWEVRAWYPPLRVHFHNHEYEGFGTVVGKRGERYWIEIGYWTYREQFLVPIRNCTPWEDYCDAHPKFDRWRESHRQHRRYRAKPILLPAPPVQTPARARKSKPDLWSEL